MMMMKMRLLLFLCGVLRVSADVLHEDLQIRGCSDSDGEAMYTLDGEEMWFADFKQGKGVEPQPPFIDHMSLVKGAYDTAVANQQICRTNLGIRRKALKDTPVERDPPSTPMIYTRDEVELGEKNILVCHVSGFYPAPVNVSWTKNGQKVTEGTSINVPFPSKDSTFTQISRLDFIPQLGDIYSCSVDHLALQKPLTRMFDVELNSPQPSVGPAVFCGLGLTIGLLGVAVGTFFLIKGNECS
ncbi:mamu class II histocompatibility antigen, DR alpha chain isoform X2 [Fundulus heteroclitus]|uniref:mamu class II histocompatibility antigen, DR alpha chain isoform X1 n=1 Tax=Fundulus heteroclitus TaxID=8078 RepID=UPI00165C274F|nr:mamu class II histocompatibility antigen, DR alpha chain isoform X1 [Fundulus heteroclitus]XP_035987033.1 mamu class II histocompatibility antigen, DR alpha chain isoform X1 [Fundulus heteroclitus]XP_035987034.1 mamu class II histocompatibility antigen, DR alpha chain isoform X2 [Fundulus heteroclitus]